MTYSELRHSTNKTETFLDVPSPKRLHFRSSFLTPFYSTVAIEIALCVKYFPSIWDTRHIPGTRKG